jgi:hypothetical protein
MANKELIPVGYNEESLKLHRDISRMLMDFVCHNHKGVKSLSKFIANGCHDIRASGVAVDIVVRVQQFLNSEKSNEKH